MAAALVAGLRTLPRVVEEALAREDEVRALAESFAGHDDVYFIGRGLDYAVAMEGSLKMKEISYIHSEAMPAGELKHGTLALVTQSTPVVVVLTQTAVYDKTISALQEVKARHAFTVALAYDDDTEIAKHADRVIRIPRVPDLLAPVPAIVPLQLLAYHVAAAPGARHRPAAQPGQERHGRIGMRIVGLGVDLAEIERVRRLLERYPRFAERCFTAHEREYAFGYARPERRLAARFAGKEAVMKSLGTGWRQIRWQDVEITGGRRPAGGAAGHGGGPGRGARGHRGAGDRDPHRHGGPGDGGGGGGGLSTGVSVWSHRSFGVRSPSPSHAPLLPSVIGVLLVDRGVVPGAQQPQVREVRGASVCPVDDVVGVAPAGRHCRIRGGCSAWSRSSRSRRMLVGDDPGGPSHLDRHRVGVEEDPADGGVAGETADGVPADGAGFGVHDALARREGVPGDGDQHLRTAPGAVAGCLAGTGGRLSTRASARAWAGVRVSLGSRLAGSASIWMTGSTSRALAGSRSPLRCTMPGQVLERCRARS